MLNSVTPKISQSLKVKSHWESSKGQSLFQVSLHFVEGYTLSDQNIENIAVFPARQMFILTFYPLV